MSPSNAAQELQQAMSYIAILLDVIDNQDWNTFSTVALANPRAFRTISRKIAACPELNGMTLLHAVVRYNPPLEMVAEMMQLCPELVYAKDCLERTPLHVAAGSGASASLVKLLAKSCPEGCNAQDEDGRTPLHLACDSSCELFEDSAALPRGPPSYDVVRTLLSQSLHSVIIEDEDEMSPLEYAIVSDASIQVVSLLQKAAQKIVKQQRGNDNDVITREVAAVTA